MSEPKILIIIEGGMVSNVVGNHDVGSGIEVHIKDYDTDNADEADLEVDSEGSECFHQVYDLETFSDEEFEAWIPKERDNGDDEA